ncbi:MAG: hypothetical protein ABI855_15450 [Bacteroidota bacterium]
MTEKKYSTSQIVTAMILDQMWRSCRSNRLKFAQFKAKYSEEFIDARLLELSATMALKSEAARALGHVRLRNEIVVLAKDGRHNWQSLKLYISNNFGNAEDECAAAGQAEYEKAGDDNFSALKSLLQQGSQYIADNRTALLANENMPAGFEADYNLNMDLIVRKLSDFYDEREASRVASADKVEKLNLCYTAGISMGADGQHIFSSEEEMSKQFSFEAVMNLISPPGAASLLADVTFNGMMKQGAELSIVGTDKTGTTDVNGEALLTQLSSGAAVCKIVCDGCQDQFINITLSPGTTSRIHVVMEPLFEGEMTVGSESTVEDQSVGIGQ